MMRNLDKKEQPKLTKDHVAAIMSGRQEPPDNLKYPWEMDSQGSDHRSGRNSTSSMPAWIRSRAKAESAKVRLKYAMKEAELAKKEFEVKLQMNLLKSKCDVEEAEAELQIMEEDGFYTRSIALSSVQMNPKEKVKNYLEKDCDDLSLQMNNNTEVQTPPGVNQTPYQLSPMNPFAASFTPQQPTTTGQQKDRNPFTNILDEFDPYPINLPAMSPGKNDELHKDALKLPLTPHLGQNTEQFGMMSEFTKFMLKKDLVKHRLYNFSDSPGSYLVWKTTFKSVMEELQVTPAEEIDLLMQHLGPTSTKYATTIRSANVHDPHRGLQRIWNRLEEEYGRPETIQTYLTSKLTDFPKLSNKDSKKLFDLVDLLSEVEAIKENPAYSSLLSYFDTSAGINPILSKLPYNAQEKWVSEAVRYKKTHNVMFPPLSYFIQFVHRLAEVRNDPCFETPIHASSSTFTKDSKQSPKPITCKKTEISPGANKDNVKVCPIHNTNHSLNDCKAFRAKTIVERKAFLKEKGLCFKCCGTVRHMAKDCKIESPTCGLCRGTHPTGLHIDEVKGHGGERQEEAVTTKCTQMCGDGFKGRSCAKIVLVRVHPRGKPHLSRSMYAIVDDQSNKSLAKSEFFQIFKENGAETPYSLLSCSGSTMASGRRAKGYIIESLDGIQWDLPTLIECNEIPDNRSEIPTPEVAQQYKHLQDIANLIPPVDDNANILLLLGRDIIKVHQVLDHRIGPGNSPYGQRLNLGWVIIGDVCLGKTHREQTVNVKKTFVMNSGQPTLFPPCDNSFTVKECNLEALFCEPDSCLFIKTRDDNKPGKSAEDREFERIMESEMIRDAEGNWETPLPFQKNRPALPNNRRQAMRRAEMLKGSLKRDPQKREHFINFMQNLFDKGFAEEAPAIPSHKECWYLPIFGVYHPRKPSQIRVVFDSSARYEGASLNQVLLPGPNLTNDLLGVLMRFRLGQIAVTADIQQMFYAFKVKEDHRDYMRFLWHKNNDIDEDLMEFRMKVHVFGNTTSPAVATYALRRTVQDSDPDVKEFVNKQFYVDDGLLSTDSIDQAVDLLKRTQHDLQVKGGLKLHKIAANRIEVMEQFTSSDLTKELQSLNFTEEYLPFHQSLGLSWDLNDDTFTFTCPKESRPFTRRGLLATINSIYDPIGFLAPVLIRGKMMLRQATSASIHWDEELSEMDQQEWLTWMNSLEALSNLQIPRAYTTFQLSTAEKKELHVFCDASEKAISAVAYLRVVGNTIGVGFALGKAKLAPLQGHTLPRLELCAAVLAVEVAESAQEALEISSKDTHYYTDSQVVLGYINNRHRRFYTYVSNRVERIRQSSKATDWHYVRSELNPADLGTRSTDAAGLADSVWLRGPTLLHQMELATYTGETFPMIEPEEDKEVRPIVNTCCKSEFSESFKLERFTKFSKWDSLVRGIAVLKRIARKHRLPQSAESTSDLRQDARIWIVKEVQEKTYSVETRCLQQGKALPRQSPLAHLNPFLDKEGIIRVGGRLQHASLGFAETHPIILPGKSHVALLIVRDCHEKSFHQGRLITEGSIRSTGYWITGVKRLISSTLRQCVRCRRLRSKEEYQIMSTLPEDRVKVEPPFSNTGVDVFGPWEVVTRKTRGGAANSKRWAALFTCLSTRAVHIEVLESMSTSSFMNAYRRFVALRGKVNLIRSDCGTNFVGAEKLIKDVKWIFNPPHSSHMGGAWERMIGVARSVLDSMLLGNSKNLTHEVLVTLMAEVSAIINSRPITAVSTDPDDPVVLSPAMLLTHRNTNIQQQDFSDMDTKDMYREQWKRVQVLTEQFWIRWKRDYLNTLQKRHKWTETVTDVKVGDIVLLKDKDSPRLVWPLGRITSVIPSADGRIRKAFVLLTKDNKTCEYERPITDLIMLVRG